VIAVAVVAIGATTLFLAKVFNDVDAG